MRTIHFKNGTTKEICQEDFEELLKIIKNKFAVFHNQETYKPFLLINVDDISFID